jgi:hypothetical protein
MSDRFRVIPLLVFGVLSAAPISPRPAEAQSLAGENTWAVLDVTAAINNAIDENKDATDLRERAVRRLSECSLMYGGLGTLASKPEIKKSYVLAQSATSDVEAAISKPLQDDKRLELEQAGRRTVALIMRGIKAQGDKEFGPLLKSCKALNDVNEIKTALRELPPL